MAHARGPIAADWDRLRAHSSDAIPAMPGWSRSTTRASPAATAARPWDRLAVPAWLKHNILFCVSGTGKLYGIRGPWSRLAAADPAEGRPQAFQLSPLSFRLLA